MSGDANAAMARHVVDNPRGRDLAFAGRRLLSHRHHDTGRVDVYETASGRYVLRQRRSSRPGVVVEDRLEIGDKLQATIETLAPGPGRNRILRALGLATVVEI
jgi:hypothetical protein